MSCSGPKTAQRITILCTQIIPQDAPTPIAKLQSRSENLKKHCTDAVGEETFYQAFTMLQKMMDETDGFVELDGQVYDGADDEQVGHMRLTISQSSELLTCTVFVIFIIVVEV